MSEEEIVEIVEKKESSSEHYICRGGCRGVAKKPCTCQAPTCRDHNHALVKCDCTDGLHNNFA